MQTVEELRALYAAAGKHAHYQVLPERLAALVGTDGLETVSRYERERWRYILENVAIAGKTVIDIGGNTGFFSFEAIGAGARHVSYYEGNPAHASFVRVAASALECADRIDVHEGYYDFSGNPAGRYDVALLLNVLHHAGDDYAGATGSIAALREHVRRGLVHMSRLASTLVFQMGFNWKGDVTCPLFAGGTKREMIEFVAAIAGDIFDTQAVGVAAGTRDSVEYSGMDISNMERIDALGEFLNRPLFILKSRCGG